MKGMNEMIEINVGVSNHHVHLSRDILDKLFGNGYELTVKRFLSQKKEFASFETVSIKVNDKVIDNVRIIGPVRNYTQVELLSSDCEYLGIKAPIRDSGDLDNSASVTIIGPKTELTIDNSCIIANNHIHINSSTYPFLNDKDVVSVITKDNKIINDVHIKKGDNFTLELHIDKDEALKYGLNNGDKVILK